MCDYSDINFEDESDFNMNAPQSMDANTMTMLRQYAEGASLQECPPITEDGGLDYTTGAELCSSPAPLPLPIGRFTIVGKGDAKMPISENKKVVVCTYKGQVYLHFFGATRKDHFSLHKEEIDNFLNNVDQVKRHIQHHRNELEKLNSKMRIFQQQQKQQKQQQQQQQHVLQNHSQPPPQQQHIQQQQQQQQPFPQHVLLEKFMGQVVQQ